MASSNGRGVPRSDPNPPGPMSVILPIIRGAVGQVPGIGPFFSELLGAFVAVPAERRLREWQAEVWNAIEQLDVRIAGTLERLQQDPAFFDTLITTSQIAMRQHQAEKHKALLAALINTALAQPSDEIERILFLGFVDRLSVAHMRLLDYLDDPRSWNARHPDAPAMPATRGALFQLSGCGVFLPKDVGDQVFRDLESFGLLRPWPPAPVHEAERFDERRSTELGRRFLTFIRHPVDLERP